MPAAEREQLEIVGEYSDEGISGIKTEQREGLKRLITDAKVKKFSVVVVDSIDRFSRLDSVDVGAIVEPLRKAGVKLFSVSEGWCDWNSFTDRIKFFLHSELGNQWLKGHAYKTLTGRIRKVKAGKICGAAPLGFDRLYFDESGQEMKRVKRGETFKKPGSWVSKLAPSEDSDLVDAIRWAFETYANTVISLIALGSEFAKRVHPLGYRFKEGSLAMCQMLSNPASVGDRSYGNASSSLFYCIGEDGQVVEGDGRRYKNPKECSAPILASNTHVGIVSREVFAKVQSRLESIPIQKRVKPRTYPLTGLLQCSTCGGSLVGGHSRTGKESNKLNRYYRCGGACGSIHVRADDLERAMIKIAIDHLDDSAKAISESIHRQLKSLSTNEHASKRSRSVRQIKKLDAKIRKAQENFLLADPGTVPQLQEILSGWIEERRAMEAEAEEVQTPQSIRVSGQDAIKTLNSIRSAFVEAETEELTSLFSGVFEEIYIEWDLKAPRGKKFR